MIGKIGITPAFKGKILLSFYVGNSSGHPMGSSVNPKEYFPIDTEDISSIKTHTMEDDTKYTDVMLKNNKKSIYSGKQLLVPETYISKHDIITAYTAAKDSDLFIDLS